MHNPDSNELLPARRKLLGSLASAAAIAGIAQFGATSAAAAPVTPEASKVDAPTAQEELFTLSRLRNYKNRRSSSWDRSGGNNDFVPLPAGQSVTLMDERGAGVITHIWFTINSGDDFHLKNLVLRAWWDGEPTPSIEVPIGDFFGLGLGEYYQYNSALLTVASIKALNAYFQMPYSSAARFTLTNEGTIPTDNLYFAIDYVVLPALPEGLGRFHAQYRQSAPCKGTLNDWTSNVNEIKNLDGKQNYVYMEATGRGHFIGVTHSVLQNQNAWFGEGDDMFFIDGDPLPTINGTGTEDYFNGAWGFDGKAFAYANSGAPYIVNQDRIGGRLSLYRWHLEGPIAFEKSLRATIEHGHANHRSDDFYSTAYWYQIEPHAPFPALPRAEDRIPRIYQAGKAGALKPPAE